MMRGRRRDVRIHVRCCGVLRLGVHHLLPIEVVNGREKRRVRGSGYVVLLGRVAVGFGGGRGGGRVLEVVHGGRVRRGVVKAVVELCGGCAGWTIHAERMWRLQRQANAAGPAHSPLRTAG